MSFDPRRLAGANGNNGQRGWFGRLLAFLITGAVVVLGLMFSLVVFAVGAVIGLLLWAYMSWKMRKLRQHMAEMAAGMASGAAGGVNGGNPFAAGERGDSGDAGREIRIIDGEVIRTGEDSHADNGDPHKLR